MLHAALFLAVWMVLKRIYDLGLLGGGRSARPSRKGAGGGAFSRPAIGLALLFAAVLVHQASWQLTGLFRPQFVAFMQSHDRREFNPAHRIQRGRILDREGQVLAYSREDAGKVRRVYPFGPAFAHTVGYSDPRYGATGAEAAANAQLNGATPERLASWGELTRQLLVQSKRPRGQDLVLNLDASLQQLALQGLGQRRGAAVLIRPRDGAVLVLANNPSFDPNWLDPVLFQGGDPTTPLLNRATQGLYPPGSTFKTVMAALAIERGFAGTIPCPAEGYTTSARYPRIRDHGFYEARQGGRSFRGYGNLDLNRAFAESSNVFFAQLGVRYGLDALLETGERLQFDRKIRLYPGRDRAGNVSTGRIPRLKERDLYGLAQASIGQGRVLATPAHMAIVAAAVANGGLAMRPRLLAQDPPEPLGQFMSAADRRAARRYDAPGGDQGDRPGHRRTRAGHRRQDRDRGEPARCGPQLVHRVRPGGRPDARGGCPGGARGLWVQRGRPHCPGPADRRSGRRGRPSGPGRAGGRRRRAGRRAKCRSARALRIAGSSTEPLR